MAIFFCSSCQWSVSDHELLNGGAVKLDQSTVYCAKCVSAGLVKFQKPQVAPPAQPIFTHAAPAPTAAIPVAPAASTPSVQMGLASKSGYVPPVRGSQSGIQKGVRTGGATGSFPAVGSRSNIQPAVGNKSNIQPAIRAAKSSSLNPAVRGGQTGMYSAVPGIRKSNTQLLSVVRTPDDSVPMPMAMPPSPRGSNSRLTGAYSPVGTSSGMARSPATAAARESDLLIIIGGTLGAVLLVTMLVVFGSKSKNPNADKLAKGKTTQPASKETKSSSGSTISDTALPLPAPRTTTTAPNTPAKTPAKTNTQPTETAPIITGLRTLTEPIDIRRPPNTATGGRTEPAPAPEVVEVEEPPPPVRPKYPPLLMERKEGEMPPPVHGSEPRVPLVASSLKLEYERVLAKVLGQLYKNQTRAASSLLEQTLSNAEFAGAKDKLKLDSDCLKLAEELRKAALDGAALLTDNRTFKLKKIAGEEIELYTGSKVKVGGVKGDNIELLHAMGSGTANSTVGIDELTPQTRYELASFSLADGPGRDLRLALAGIIKMPDGEQFPSPKGVRNMLTIAAKDAALSTLVEHLRYLCDFQESMINSSIRFKEIEDTLKEQRWNRARKLIDAFKTDFANSYALSLVQADLENYAATIEKTAASADAAVQARRDGLWVTYWSLSADGKFLNKLIERTERSFEFTYKDRGPDAKVPVDSFGARYRGLLMADKEGVCKFSAIVDGQVTMWINGRNIIESKSSLKGQATLNKGANEVLIEYFNQAGPASMSLKWMPDGASDWQEVPGASLAFDEEHKKADK